ncbi:MAG: hypothetical protein MZV70_05760 [Desulfobacterales bacterium]|nr:hypothetical protein [Desulfobacterales bacterium]
MAFLEAHKFDYSLHPHGQDTPGDQDRSQEDPQGTFQAGRGLPLRGRGRQGTTWWASSRPTGSGPWSV